MTNTNRKSTPSTATARLAAAQAAFDALAAARTASAVAAGIDPECDSRPRSAAMKRAAVALGLARAAVDAAAARRAADAEAGCRAMLAAAPAAEAAPLAGTGSAAQAAANDAWNEAAAREAALHAAAAAVDAAAREHGFNGPEHPAALAAYSAALAAHRLAVAAAEAAASAPVEVTAETLLEEIANLRGQSLDFYMSRAGRARICLRNNPYIRAEATLALAATLEAMRLNLAARAADAASRKLIEAMETEEDAAAQDAATLRPTADGEAVDAVACLATLPASLVEAARAYLAAVAADCGVADAARHFGAEKDAVAFEHTGDAAAEARALISAANYNAAVKDFRAACKAARNA